MGYFLDFLTGGNIKVAAASLSGLHFHFNGDYLATFTTRIISLMQQSLAKRNAKTYSTIDMLCNNEIKNYTDLTILDLSINAAPDSIPYYETFNTFSREVAIYLNKKNVPLQYVSGDNRRLTQEFANSMKELGR